MRRSVVIAALALVAAAAALVQAPSVSAYTLVSATGTTYGVVQAGPFIGCQSRTIWTQHEGLAPAESGWHGFGGERLTVYLWRWNGTAWAYVGNRSTTTTAGGPFGSVSFGSLSAGSYAVTFAVAWFAESWYGGTKMGERYMQAAAGDFKTIAPNWIATYNGVGYCHMP